MGTRAKFFVFTARFHDPSGASNGRTISFYFIHQLETELEEQQVLLTLTLEQSITNKVNAANVPEQDPLVT